MGNNILYKYSIFFNKKKDKVFEENKEDIQRLFFFSILISKITF